MFIILIHFLIPTDSVNLVKNMFEKTCGGRIYEPTPTRQNVMRLWTKKVEILSAFGKRTITYKFTPKDYTTDLKEFEKEIRNNVIEVIRTDLENHKAIFSEISYIKRLPSFSNRCVLATKRL